MHERSFFQANDAKQRSESSLFISMMIFNEDQYDGLSKGMRDA